MLVAKDISLKIGEVSVLDGVNLSVNAGEIVSLLGPNGGGKSSVLKVMSLLVKPSTGTVEHIGSQGEKLCLEWPEVTLVNQNFALWPHMTVRENITLAAGKLGKLNNQGLNELIEYFQIEEFLERMPHQISGGQRQRAALVRTMILKPKFLLLDEVTSALDSEHVANLERKLLELRAQGMGILLVTHQLAFAERISDRIIRIEKGKIR